MRPMTERIPKSLVDVAGRPFAVHRIELLRRDGLTDINDAAQAGFAV
jgi:NDP-sugar pyrophosphorylase family protein